MAIAAKLAPSTESPGASAAPIDPASRSRESVGLAADASRAERHGAASLYRPDLPKLTATQQLVLQYIIASVEERGYPPTYREMAASFGWAGTNAAADHLKALKRKGYIVIDPFASRGIQVVGVRWRMVPDAGEPSR